MNVIVCLDDCEGMTFNRRRQSRDRVVTADIVREAGERLCMCPYSESLFLETEIERLVSENFLDEAQSGDWCFVENRALSPYREQIDEVLVYRWNRHYPSDTTFDLNLAAEGFRLAEREELEGYSHEKITKERFVR